VQQLIDSGMANAGDSVNAFFTSYSGNYGSFYIVLPACGATAAAIEQANGVFNDLAPTRYATITDGLSNTILVSEKATTLFRKLESVDPDIPDRFGWYFMNNWGDTIFSTFYPPNAYLKIPAGAVKAQVYSASSLHHSGINTLMGDGSARFVKETIQSWPFNPESGTPAGAHVNLDGSWSMVPPPGIWQALSTKAGNEVIHPFDQ
jgi:hypothetical protein